MHRIDSNGTAVALPTPGAVGATVGYFTEGNPGTGTPATVVSADFMNAVQEEIAYCILQNKGSLDKTTNTGLQTAMIHLSTNRPNLLQNIGFVTSVAAGALTITGKACDQNNLSSVNIARMGFRSAGLSSASVTIRSLVANIPLVVPSGATLGSQSGVPDYLYVWALDNGANGGGVELCVSGANFSTESGIASTTAISAAATSSSVIYSTTARADVPVTLLGRILYTQTTAGTWASAGTILKLDGQGPNSDFETGSFTVNFNQGAGAGGTNTSKAVKFSRHKNVVTLDFSDNMSNITTGATLSSNMATAAAAIPTRLTPITANRNFMVCGVVSGTAADNPAKLTIATDGSIVLNRVGSGGTNWTQSNANNGMQSSSVTYTLA